MQYTVFYVTSPCDAHGRTMGKYAIETFSSKEEQEKAYNETDERHMRSTGCSAVSFEFLKNGIRVWNPEGEEAIVYGTNKQSRYVPNGTVLTKEGDEPYFNALVKFSKRQ